MPTADERSQKQPTFLQLTAKQMVETIPLAKCKSAIPATAKYPQYSYSAHNSFTAQQLQLIDCRG